MQLSPSTQQGPLVPVSTVASGAVTPQNLAFPPEAMVGSIGALAHTLADGRGTLIRCGLDGFRLNVWRRSERKHGFRVEPRLYTVLLGDSYAVKNRQSPFGF